MKKRFIRKLILFSTPLIIVFSGFLIALPIYTGDVIPIQMVIDAQNHDARLLFQATGNEAVFAYKLNSVRDHHRNVVVIGSSRILQFRSGLLTSDEATFFNAGGSAWRLHHIEAFVNALTAVDAPDVMIIGLDQPWFNDDFVDWNPIRPLDLQYFNFDRLIRAGRRISRNLILGSIDIRLLLARREPVYGNPALGLSAIQRGVGYRSDGSYQRPDIIDDPLEWEGRHQSHHDILDFRDRMYMLGDSVSVSSLQQLENILRAAEERGIYVIGYAPPFATSIYDRLQASEDHQYLPEAISHIENVFESYDRPFFDYSNSAWLSENNSEMYDGWHSTELMSLRIYMQMVEALPEVLGPYSDLAELEQIANAAENPVEVFGNSF